MRKSVGLLALIAELFPGISTEKKPKAQIPTHPRLKRKTSAQRDAFEKNRLERKTAQGVRKFWYGSEFVEARNQKNADRKARNRGLMAEA